MIALSLEEIAEVVSGEVVATGGSGNAPGPVTVDGPVVLDGRAAGPGSLFVAIAGERTDGHLHAAQAGENGAVAVLGSRPTELSTVVVEDVQTALQQLASYVAGRLRDHHDLRVIAITGSQGKTSTKDMLGAVLSGIAPTVATPGSRNNELGMPLTVLESDVQTRFLVLEMGARGIGHIAELARIVPPDVAVVLNVGQAHLGEFGSQDAIAVAKGELVESLVADGVAVLNADDHRVAAMAARAAGSRVITFGTGEAADVRVEGLRLDRLGRPAFTLVTADERADVALTLVGAHQALNAAAVAAAGIAVGAPLADIASGLSGVTSLSQWRMELHELDRGIIVLNDAYNANPDSMRAALDALASIGADDGVRRTVAVLGVMLELGGTSESEHAAIGTYAAERGIDRVLVVGEDARGIHVGAGERSTFVPDNAAAIAWLQENLDEGDAVLFKASRGASLDEVAATLQ